ncbi:hypothetical protein Vadar_017899 [Vaccinium darrowii]|uniref:Uncharacterized protein n=1 Tax=Vaccinium darrowii TaxID=229202 RepID=A0ACB7XRH5_9ERIC|nr:hypothetical protein Vadar_017899 [Vaccinium darrowii]
MKSDSETGHSDHSPKPRRPKSREVSSRFLSSTSLPSPERKLDFPSPKQTLSPIKQKPRSSIHSRKHKSIGGSSDEEGGFIRGQWPPTPLRTSSSSKKLDTFGDYLGKERIKDLKIDNSPKVHQNIENPLFEFEILNGKNVVKENHKSFFGGLGFSRRSSNASAIKSSYYTPHLLGDEIGLAPGRFSVDETALRRRTLGPASDTADSGSECSDVSSGFRNGFAGKNPSRGSHLSSTARRYVKTLSPNQKFKLVQIDIPSLPRSGVDVSSKYLQDLRAKTRVRTSDSNVPVPGLFDKSPKSRTSKSATGFGGAGPKWASSPGREVLPPMSVENRGKPPMSVENRGKPPPAFSNLRPKGKGVGNLLSKGLDLFRGKKTTAAVAVVAGGGDAVVGERAYQPRPKHTAVAAGGGAVVADGGGAALWGGGGESGHQLRLMHTRLIQWRFVNARGGLVNQTITKQSESNFVGAFNSLTELQHSVVQKKLQLEEEKLGMKLNFILHSHIKALEAWGDMETQHISAVSRTKDSFHSVICRVPLVEGAKMDQHSAYFALQHAVDLATSINSMLYNISPTAEKRIAMILELAEVVAQEKALLHEFMELLTVISTLEVNEDA